jgi:hypothetical protein
MKKNINNNLSIFNKYQNNNFKSVPLYERLDDIGNTKYFPPTIKEWKNIIYVFNSNSIKNLPAYNIDINYLIKTYFNLYFKNKIFKGKLEPNNSNRLSINKIFVSKAEIKHTNSKAVVTVYTYNREKLILLNKIDTLKKLISNKILLLLYKGNKLYKNISPFFYFKTVRALLYKELILLRRFKLKLTLNKNKFEEMFLYKLSKLISRLYNKKVELNIVNLKSIVFNSDLFTKILTLKLKNRKADVIEMMDFILNSVVLPEVNLKTKKDTEFKNIDSNLIENKFKSLNLNSILKDNNNLDNLLSNLYYNTTLDDNIKNGYNKIYEIIFNSIKYKNMRGIKLEIKGRLTKRYKADRAILKMKLKGGLKNIDSSFKRLSSVNMRGYIRPNSEYSIFTSKRRIGTFAVKGWISAE